MDNCQSIIRKGNNLEPDGQPKNFRTAIKEKDTYVNLGFHSGDIRHRTVEARLQELHLAERRDRAKNDYVEEDVFVALHDPMGVAEDISAILAEKILDFKALIEAIQTGETVEAARARVLCGDGHPEENNRAHKDLFALALCTYQVVYNSDHAIQMYDGGKPGWELIGSHYPGKTNRNTVKPSPLSSYTANGVPVGESPNYRTITYGVDRTKVEGILGVAVRKKKLADIQRWRDVYGGVIQREYFRKTLCFYLDNSDEHRLEGLGRVADQLLAFYNNPNEYDRHLQLAKDYDDQDKWSTWVEGLMAGEECDNNPELVRLLGEELAIREQLLKGSLFVNLSNKMARAIRALLQLHSKEYLKTLRILDNQTGPRYYVDRGTKSFTKFFRKADKIKIQAIQGGELLPIFEQSVKKSGSVGGAVLSNADDAFLTITDKAEIAAEVNHVLRVSNKRVSLLRAFIHNIKNGGGTRQNAVAITVRDLKRIGEEQFRAEQTKELRFNERAARMVNSKAFAEVLVVLQVLNISRAVFSLISEIKKTDASRLDIGFSGLNFIGISTQLTDSYLSLKRVMLLSSGDKLAADALVKYINTAAAWGGIITASMAFYDAYKAFSKRDVDAGFALVGSGVSFGISSLVPFGILTGPVGWICIGTGVGLAVLATALIDTELENFLKNFILSDKIEIFHREQETPMEYARRINAKIGAYDKNEIYRSILTPKGALVRLNDLIVCDKITCSPISFSENRLVDYDGWFYWLECFLVAIQFNQYLSSADQVEFKLLLTNDDQLSCNYGRDITLYVEDKRIRDCKNGGVLFEADIGVPELFRSIRFRNVRPIIALRLRMHESEYSYFPYSYEDGVDRYLGIRFPLTKGERKMDYKNMTIATGFQRSIARRTTTGSLAELKTREIWL